MNIPYLIQRATFQNREGKQGIDSILSFDYMGSAECEFGSLSKSLSRIRSNSNISFDCDLGKGKTVTVYCRNKDQKSVSEYINQLSSNKLRLKEYCDLYDWMNPNPIMPCRNDFWWDIDNDFMFWRKDKKFTKKFMVLINKS